VQSATAIHIYYPSTGACMWIQPGSLASHRIALERGRGGRHLPAASETCRRRLQRYVPRTHARLPVRYAIHMYLRCVLAVVSMICVYYIISWGRLSPPRPCRILINVSFILINVSFILINVSFILRNVSFILRNVSVIPCRIRRAR
jgi:hypothetical protein